MTKSKEVKTIVVESNELTKIEMPKTETPKTVFVPAWSESLSASLLEMYTGDNSELGEIGKRLGKSVPSVRAKLVNLGAYRKAVTAGGFAGASTVRKITIVRNISAEIKCCELSSLVKASKADLELLHTCIIAAMIAAKKA
jgi:hypothetical protein